MKQWERDRHIGGIVDEWPQQKKEELMKWFLKPSANAALIRGRVARARWRPAAMFGRTVAALCIALKAAGAVAQDAAGPKSPKDLSRLTIEELANIEITSVSKRSEPLSAAAAAVYVITREDIRRSGAT